VGKSEETIKEKSTETILGSGKPLSIVCAEAELEEDALTLLEEADGVPAFLETLCEEDRYEEAIAFLAQALPPREAVGWAWVCAREAVGEDAPPSVQESLEATRAWIQEPSDAIRRAAFNAADEAGMATPAGCAGLAAFFSGDSLAPADSEPAPPPEGLSGRTVAGCVHVSAAWGEPEDVAARYEDFMRRGLELAERVDLWNTTEITATGSPDA
jgi:hypothetical protein